MITWYQDKFYFYNKSKTCSLIEIIYLGDLSILKIICHIYTRKDYKFSIADYKGNRKYSQVQSLLKIIILIQLKIKIYCR